EARGGARLARPEALRRRRGGVRPEPPRGADARGRRRRRDQHHLDRHAARLRDARPHPPTRPGRHPRSLLSPAAHRDEAGPAGRPPAGGPRTRHPTDTTPPRSSRKETHMSGQDWLDKDFYAVLGVSKDADAQEIKKAYRKQARKYHPDHHPDDPKAEERFKEIGEAYSVLNDAEQREQYDAIRAMGSGGARFSAGQGGPRTAPGAGGEPDVEDLLRMFGGQGGGFGGGGPAGFSSHRAPTKGADTSARTKLSFRDAALGTELKLTVDGRSVTTRIPAG